MATTHQQQQLDAEISVLPNIETLDPPSTTGTNPEPPVSMLLDGPSLWPEAPPQYTPNDPLRNCKPPAYVADGSDVEDGARRHREKRMKLIFIGLAVVLVVVFVAAMAGGMVAGRKNASKMADRKNASNKVDRFVASAWDVLAALV